MKQIQMYYRSGTGRMLPQLPSRRGSTLLRKMM